MPSKSGRKSKSGKKRSPSQGQGSKADLMKKCRKLKIKCGGMTVAAMRDAIRHAGGIKRGRRPSSKSSGSRSALVKKMKKLGLSHKSKSVAQMRSALKHQRSAKKKGYSEISGKSPKRNRWIEYYRKHAAAYKAQHPKAKHSTVMKQIAREYKKRRDAGALSPSMPKSVRKSASKSASKSSSHKSASPKKSKPKKARGRKPSSKKKGSKHDLRKKYKKLYGKLPPQYMTIADLKKAISKHSNSSGDLSLEEFNEGDIARVLSPKKASPKRSSSKRRSSSKGRSTRRLLSSSPPPQRGRHREMSDDEVSKEFVDDIDEEFNRF